MATVNASTHGLQVLQSTGKVCLLFIIIYYKVAVLLLLYTFLYFLRIKLPIAC